MNHRLCVFILLILIGIGSPAWALFCSSCGAKTADDAKFCPQCGKPFAATETVASSTGVSPLVFTGSMGTPTTLIAPPSPQAFQVTSHYLLLNGYRVPRNQLFWISEIAGNRARIWCLNDPPVYGPVMGWVSLSELEKRSTWKSNITTYCVEPPPPTAEIVIVHERPYWRHWTPRPIIFSWSSSDHSRHRRSDSHRRH